MKKIIYPIIAIQIMLASQSFCGDIDFGEHSIGRRHDIGVLADNQHYHLATQAMEDQAWSVAYKEFNVLIHKYPHSEFTPDSYYFSGVCLYKLREFEQANMALNNYMKSNTSPKYFEETIRYKFSIAEHFRGGEKRRAFGALQFPKFLSGHRIALEIYDEVVATMPSHELSALSLYHKGCLLWKLQEYRESVEAYQMFIRRFPKHELTPQSYCNISKVYLDLSRYEFQNPDIISLAEVNVKKFRQDFPREESVDLADIEVKRIKEVYASGLYETGQFYERKCKPRASVIYYESAIRQFPETSIAQQCRSRLSKLAPSVISSIDEMLQSENINSDALDIFDEIGEINFEEFKPQ